MNHIRNQRFGLIAILVLLDSLSADLISNRPCQRLSSFDHASQPKHSTYFRGLYCGWQLLNHLIPQVYVTPKGETGWLDLSQEGTPNKGPNKTTEQLWLGDTVVVLGVNKCSYVLLALVTARAMPRVLSNLLHNS